jgi:predicted RNase H-like HicB family nuclease
MTESERYLILVEGGPPSNYSAWSPEVLGCVATGNTIDECVEELRAALASHLSLMRKRRRNHSRTIRTGDLRRAHRSSLTPRSGAKRTL